ncbi:MAG: bifunctional 5,10-methylenetetrahydrofolate dehydrogenase/5,10-methenyltetrahydrofolate cyclohydrolase [Coriobacteriales bacterium]|jgi:methylenetetrahydrofolate dehydrogenase (NADP+)/methenyltetrahydrofolate cyclohydrolase|nr:bifunctional 5,10-methylenetetrahydrofolate dehydrogenase/5,10-methenyltetrahydrofolate cyclohydrolase [Coriobacteriales bacterium]
MARTLKGTEVAEALNSETIKEVEALKAGGVEPTLAILRVGERADDVSYERGVARRAEKVGVAVRNIVLPADAGQDALTKAIEALNADSSVHGVLMFRPLPPSLDEGVARNALDPAKDVDGITDASLAGVFAGANTGYAPCTPSACMELLDHYGIDPAGRSVVVVGRSLVVGKPVAMMLLGRNATVTVCHSRTKELFSVVREADIVIACVGCAHLLGTDHLAPGQIVIDVGINVADDGTLVGDVDFEAARGVVDALTPVPGGVGTVTTSVLVKHVVEAAMRQT